MVSLAQKNGTEQSFLSHKGQHATWAPITADALEMGSLPGGTPGSWQWTTPRSKAMGGSQGFGQEPWPWMPVNG